MKLNDVMESMTLLLKKQKKSRWAYNNRQDIPRVVHLFPMKDEKILAELEQWLNADDQNKKDLVWP